MDDFTKGLIGFGILFFIGNLMMVYKIFDAKNKEKSVLRAIIPFTVAEMFLIASFLMWYFKNNT